MIIKTPINQVRMTNVVIVRYNWKSGKMRFEIACYKNKVIDWRNGKETDINQVLQSQGIYTNVSKGEMARQVDLHNAFGKMKYENIVAEILNNGSFQVSELERESKLDALKKDVAKIVSEKTINPTNNKPYPLTMIEKAMESINFNVNLKQAAKVQALILIKKLADVIPIERKKLKIKISFDASLNDTFSEFIKGLDKGEDEMKLLKEEIQGLDQNYFYLIQPPLFKELSVKLQEVLESVSIELQDQAFQEQVKEQALDEEEKQISDILDSKSAEKEITKKVERVMREQSSTEGKKMSCTTCLDISFTNNVEFRQHFKTPWHRFNLSRKMRNEDPLDQEAYKQAELEKLHDDLLFGNETKRKKQKKGKRKEKESIPQAGLKLIQKYNAEGVPDTSGKQKKRKNKMKGKEAREVEDELEQAKFDETQENERAAKLHSVLQSLQKNEDEGEY